jgi:hypothetical protein
MEEVDEFVRTLKGRPQRTTLVSGGARGVDARAESLALRLRIPVVSWRVRELPSGRFTIVRWYFEGGDGEMTNGGGRSWPTFGLAAYARNLRIVSEADRVRAFWDGKSPGTRHTIAIARAAGKLD